MAANAQVSDDAVRIGVFTDMSDIYFDLAGDGASKPFVWRSRIWGRKPEGRLSMWLSMIISTKQMRLRRAREWFEFNGSSNIGITNDVCAPSMQSAGRHWQKTITKRSESQRFPLLI